MTAFQLTRDSIEARDIAADTAALEQRIEAFRDEQPSADPDLIIDPDLEPPANEGRIPQIDAAELTVDVLRSAISEHGALNVRGMFSPESIRELPGAIDQVLDAVDSPKEVKRKLVSHYYHPPANLASIMPGKGMELGALRVFNTKVGAAMCAEAPCVAEMLFELYEEHKLKELITAYLGEPPCLSVKKWMLRRSTLPVDKSGWHQDGAFMGTDINSINLWLPLTDCGGETGAPGMDIVPQRLHTIASAEGATFDWSVSDEYVNKRFSATPPVAPVFKAGDAFFFDHLYLHRTQFREDFTALRYAIETWFFGVSTFPKDQIPLAW
jgi:hypothetical protein